MTLAHDRLLVAEVFGPTVQGEGRRLGQRCSFVRLGACNLACTWCDTPYTWDRTRFNLTRELTTRSASDIAAEVAGHGTKLTVITGGEPLLQQHRIGWRALVEDLLSCYRSVEVETNGTQVPAMNRAGLTYNVSPKLAHSGDPEDARIVPAALHEFGHLARANVADWKFVVADRGDLAEVNALVQRFNVPASRVWVMPEGTDQATITGRAGDLADVVIGQGYNLTTRLHVLLWGQERKR